MEAGTLMWRADDYQEDLMAQNPSMPATDPIFRGAAFQPQTMIGPTFNDPGDDRVSFIGDASDPSVMLHRSQALPDVVWGDGAGITTQIQPNPEGGAQAPQHVGVPGAATPQRPGAWYDTLRPQAGYPLPLMSDQTYADITGDQNGTPFGQHDPYLVDVGDRIVAEKPLDMPTIISGGAVISRKSMPPSTDQAIYEEWDTVMGAQLWSGQKDALERPIADAGPWYTQAIRDGIPSPTGSSAMYVDNHVYAEPLTWRAPPTPWDQGLNEDNGRYVESGYY